jgi:hypothetical protein
MKKWYKRVMIVLMLVNVFSIVVPNTAFAKPKTKEEIKAHEQTVRKQLEKDKFEARTKARSLVQTVSNGILDFLEGVGTLLAIYGNVEWIVGWKNFNSESQSNGVRKFVGGLGWVCIREIIRCITGWSY